MTEANTSNDVAELTAATTTPELEVGQQNTTGEKTFTQEDLDRFFKDRLKRERDKYADYADLKAAAAKLTEIEEANKTELEKATEKLAALQEQNVLLESKRVEALIRSEVYKEATAMAIKPDLAWKLVDMDAIEVGEKDAISGVKEALKALITAYPELQQKPRGDLDGSKGGSGEKQIAQMSENEVQEWASTYGVPLEDAKAALREQGRI